VRRLFSKENHDFRKNHEFKLFSQNQSKLKKYNILYPLKNGIHPVLKRPGY